MAPARVNALYFMVLCACLVLPAPIRGATGGNSARMTFAPNIVHWDSGTWNDPYTITVTAKNDNIQNSANKFTIIHNVVDQNVNVLFTSTVTITIIDDDVAGIRISRNATLVKEGGSSIPIDVRLNSEPAKPVTLDTKGSPLSISPSRIIFAKTNWATTQRIQVSAIADNVQAATRATGTLVTLTTSSADAYYNRATEVQSVTITGTSLGGSVVLSYNGISTTSIPVGSSAATVRSALLGLSNVYGMSVVTSSVANGFAWTCNFTTNSGDLPALGISTAGLTGSNIQALGAEVFKGLPPYSPSGSGEFRLSLIDKDKPLYISTITAANDGNQAGPGTGDTLTIVFAEDTNRPDVSTTAAINALFTFSASLGSSYSGQWVWTALASANGRATAGSTSVQIPADVTSILDAGDSLQVGSTTYTVASTSVTGVGTSAVTTTVVLTTPFTGATSSLLTISHRSRTTLKITLNSMTGAGTAKQLAVGTLTVTMKTGAGLADRYSVASPATAAVLVSFGSWGALDTPIVSTVTAVATGPAAGIDAGDAITVLFDSDTNMGGIATSVNKAKVDSMFSFTANGNTVSIGSAYTGSWDTVRQFRITLGSTTGMADTSLTRVGLLKVTALTTSGIRAIDNSSAVATGSGVIGGTWGARAAPRLSSFVAADAPGTLASPGESVGDTITLTFDQATNMPAAASKAQLAAFLKFPVSLGNGLSGVWSSSSVLVITVTDVTSAAAPDLTRVGLFNVTLSSIVSADLSSPGGSTTTVLTGTWGAWPAPRITTATAANGGVAGISAGDTLTVVFDKETNRPALTPTNMFTFSSALTTNPSTELTGSWTDYTTYTINLVGVTGANLVDTRIGALQITARTGASIQTRDLSSPAASNSVTVGGTWGAQAAPAIVSAVASNDGSQPGVGNGDKLTITFDKDTNRLAGATEVVSSFLTFGASIGNGLSGTWSSARVLVITITDATGAARPSLVRPGTLRIDVKSTTQLLSADRSSPASTSFIVISGTWGAYSAPAITSAVASDPVSTAASAGFGANDQLTITFDLATSQPDVSTKAAVDALLQFSASSMGAAYTGAWTASNVLKITFSDPSGSVPTQVAIGTLAVSVKTAAGLTSEDGSSAASSSSATVTGTWGAYPAPAISSAVAADGGSNAGLGVGDTIVVSFNMATSVAAATVWTTSQVAANIYFPVPVGSLSGVWDSPSQLTLTVVTVGSATQDQTRIGALFLRLRTAAGVKSQDGSSPVSTAAAVLTGTWGAQAAPTLTSATAADVTPPVGGISNGDTVTLTFSVPTNRIADAEIQTIATSANVGASVGGSFIVSFYGESTAALAHSTTDTDMATALNGLLSIGPGGVVVTRSGPSAQGGYVWSVTFQRACRYCIGDVDALQVDKSALTGTGANCVVAQVSAGNIITTGLSNLLTFSSPLGASIRGTWTDSSTLVITITDVTGADSAATRIGLVAVSMQSGNSLLTADASSPAATGASLALVGSWGVRSAPAIVSAVAAAGSPAVAGISAGDTILVTFDQQTNMPAVAANAPTTFLVPSSSLGPTSSGTWVSSTQYRITLTNTTGVDIAGTAIGTLALQVAAATGLKSADLSSPASTSRATVTGTWGDHPKPVLLSATAIDAGGVPGINAGDHIKLMFDVDTSRPSALPTVLFALSSDPGTMTGSWTSTKEYTIVLTGPQAADLAATAVGTLQITARVAGAIKTLDGASPAADNTVTLGGSWGAHTAPIITSAVAAATGTAAGVDNGDSIRVTFDQPVSRNAGATEDAATVFSFSASLGSDLLATWTNTSSCLITIRNSAGVATPRLVKIGVISVTVRSSANLVSRDRSSSASNSQAALTGTWGPYSAPAIVSVVAADPGGTLATAGISNADTMTVTFDIATNQPTVTTTADVNALLSFSAPLGTSYTGTWASGKVLRITLVDVGGADIPGTSVGTLIVTVKQAGNLLSEDTTSPRSTSSGTLSGSWGNRLAPQVILVTAQDTGNNAGLGAGDSLLIDFDVATNQVTVGTQTAINALLQFSSPIGTALSAVWVNAARLKVTTTTLGTVSRAATRVGTLVVTVNSGAGLLTSDRSSPACSGYKVVTAGTWGAMSLGATSLVAANAGNNQGIGAGDTVTFTLDAETNQPGGVEVQSVQVTQLAGATGSLALTLSGFTTSALSAAANSSVVKSALESLPTVGSGGVTVTISSSGSTQTWAVSFTNCAICGGQLPLLVAGSLVRTSVAVSRTASGADLSMAAVNSILAFSTSLGPSYAGRWTSSSSLVVTLNSVDSTTAAKTAIGVLQASVLSTGKLLSADRSSAAVNVTQPVTGTWGPHNAPRIVSATAYDSSPGQPGISVGDAIVLTFDKRTNSAASPASWVSFSDPIGTVAYSWLSPTQLRIVITGGLANVSPALTRVGRLRITVSPSGNLKSEDLSSPACDDSAVLGGSWGTQPAPQLLTAFAQNGAPYTAGLSDGDTLLLTFSASTNQPAVATKANIDALLSFSTSLGTNYVGRWVDSQSLNLTITAGAAGTSAAATRPGVFKVTMATNNPLKSADESSPIGYGSATLTGSWGAQSTPTIVSVTAVDTGLQPGLGNGDSLKVQFSLATNQPVVNTTAALAQVLQFSANVGAQQRGSWLSPSVLVVTFLDTTGRAAPQSVVAGVMTVSILASGGIQSADYSSGVVTASNRNIQGSFGPYPAPSLLSAVAFNSGGRAGLNTGDSVILSFDIDTNKPSDVLSFLQFSATLGAQLRATWTSSSVLNVTVTDASTADPPHVTRIGLLQVSVLSNLLTGVRSADASSPASDAKQLASGTWGPFQAPIITSAVATNSGGQTGLGSGDSIIVNFDIPTTIPTLGTFAMDVFHVSAPVGTTVWGSWNSVAMAGTATVTNGGTIVRTTAGMRGSLLNVGSVVRIGTFETTIVEPFDATQMTLATPYTGASASGVTVYAPSRTSAVLIVTNATGADVVGSRVGVLRVAVMQAANVQSSDMTSPVSTSEATLSGTWGPKPAPIVTAVKVQDASVTGLATAGAGLSVGDQIHVLFDQATNMPSVKSKAAVDAVLRFSASIGANYTATWINRVLPGTASATPGADVVVTTEDMRPFLSPGDAFRVGLQEYTVAPSGVFSASSIPIVGTVPTSGRVARLLAASDTSSTLSSPIYGPSPDLLVVRILDPTGASPTATAPGALVVTAIGMRTQDLSSPLSSTSGTAAGSWNPSPEIVSAVAVNRVVGYSPGLDAGDALLIVFNVGTNTPAIGTKAQVDSLFSFSSPLGSNYTGSWLNSATAQIRITDATGAGAPQVMQAGVFRVNVRSSGNLKNSAGDSAVSTSSAVIAGLWGAERQPELTGVVAQDSGGAPGLGYGDSIVLQFNRATNMPVIAATTEVQTITAATSLAIEVQTVSTTASNVAGFFKLKFGTEVTDPISVNAVAMISQETGGAYGLGLGESMQSKLQALPSVGLVSVARSVIATTGAVRWTITFLSYQGNAPQLQTQDLALTGTNANIVVATVTNGAVLRGNMRVGFKGSTSAAVTVDPGSDAFLAQLQGAIRGLPGLGAVVVSQRVTAKSGSSVWTVTMAGTVGAQSALSVTSSWEAPTAVDTATPVPGVSSLSQLTRLFGFSTALPDSVTATFASPSALQITFYSDFSIAQAQNLGRLSVTTLTDPDYTIRSAGASVPVRDSSAAISLSGSWGARAAPRLTNCTAQDAGSPGISAGDSLKLVFDVATNVPPAGSMAAVDALIQFSSPIGCNYTGAWSANGRILTITVLDAGCATPSQVAPGVLQVTVIGEVKAADGYSSACRDTARLSGSWGVQAAPKLISVEAITGVKSLGIQSGDEVRIVFDSPTNRPSIASKAEIDAIFDFSPASLGAAYTGEWEWQQLPFEAVLSSDHMRLVAANPKLSLLLGPGDQVRTWGAIGVVASRRSNSGVVSLQSALVADNAEPKSAPVYIRSRTSLVITVTDATGATGGSSDDTSPGALTARVRPSSGLRSEDLSVSAATTSTTVTGSWGAVPWYEELWIWLMIAGILLFLCCLAFLIRFIRENYIVCTRGTRIGDQTYQPSNPTGVYVEASLRPGVHGFVTAGV